jgi:hypothetical protein
MLKLTAEKVTEIPEILLSLEFAPNLDLLDTMQNARICKKKNNNNSKQIGAT